MSATERPAPWVPGLYTRASDLRIGDVVHMNSQVVWRVVELLGVSAKQISYRFTYLQCDGAESNVGTQGTYTHRHRTQLKVTRR